MSLPEMRGFKGEVARWSNEIDNTSDDRAFNLGAVEPEGIVNKPNAWWYNFGYAYLYDGRLSLVANPTVDKGADADTLDVMAFVTGIPGDYLSWRVDATVSNTSGWTYPIVEPFKPFLDKFKAGVNWRPPLGAASGIIRKAFQWDGSYYPDTWDYKYYPISNGKFPDNDFWVESWLKYQHASSHFKILVGASFTSGYYLEFWTPNTTGAYAFYGFHNSDGYTWHDNVDNSTGYVISTEWEAAEMNGSNHGISVEDGTYVFKIWSWKDAGVQKIVLPATWHTGGDLTFIPSTGPRNIDIIVHGGHLEIKENGVLKIDATLDRNTSIKTLCFGGLNRYDSPHPGGWGYSRWGYFNFYCGGTTKPNY